jgi:uncharacterized protein YukE
MTQTGAPVVRAHTGQLAKTHADFVALAATLHGTTAALVDAHAVLIAHRGWVGTGADAFDAEFTHVLLPQVHRLTDAVVAGAAVTRQIELVFAMADADAAELLGICRKSPHGINVPGLIGPKPWPAPVIRKPDGPDIEFPPNGEFPVPKPPRGDFPTPFPGKPRGGTYPVPLPGLPPNGGTFPVPFPGVPPVGGKRDPIGRVENKNNPIDRRVDELCEMYGCSDQERREIGKLIHLEKKGGGGYDGENLPEEVLEDLIVEVISRRNRRRR